MPDIAARRVAVPSVRRRTARLGLLTALLTAFTVMTPASTAHADETVVIPDPELAVCLHNELGTDAAEPVTSDQLAGLTSVRCYQDIVDLTGIEHLTAVTSLRFINANRLADLRPVAALRQLTWLTFDTGALAVSDLRPLAGLTDLETLDVNNSKVSDVSPLRGLTKLRFVDLHESRVADARPLAGLGCDTRLDLSSQYPWLAPAIMTVPTPFALYDTAGNPALVDQQQGGITGPGELPPTLDPASGGGTVTYPETGVWSFRLKGSDPCESHQFSGVYRQQALTPTARDLTGDGTADRAVYRPSTSTWYVRGQAARRFGELGDVPAAGKYDGVDRPAVLGVMRPGVQWLVQGRQVPTNAFVLEGMVPVPGDYDGDGVDEVTGFWAGRWSRWGGREVVFTKFGEAGDIPVPADYDGDRVTDRAVFRPSTGQWIVQDGPTVRYGTAGDIPVPADIDGDGKAELVVFRPSNGRWYIRGRASVHYGKAGDAPVPGDYDGDGKVELAVFRASTGQWFVKGQTTVRYGKLGDFPL